MDVGNNDFRFTKLYNDSREEKEGKPQRDPARAELHIDSLDRYQTNSPAMPAGVRTQQLAKLVGPIVTPAATFTGGPGYTGNNFVINGKNARNLIYGYFERIALTQIQMFYRCPTIISLDDWQFGNGLLYLSYFQASSATTLTRGFTIPTGNYTPTALAANLQVQIRNWPSLNPTAFTVAFTNGQFVFSTNVVGDTIAATPYGFGSLGTSEILNTAAFRTAKLFGFGADAYVTGVGGAATIFGRKPNLLYTDYVDVCSTSLCKYKRVKDTNTTEGALQNVVCRIYLTGNNTSTSPLTNSVVPNDNTVNPVVFFPIINSSWITPNFNKWSVEEALSSIDFQLYDMYGNPLYWSSVFNTEFQCTLTVSET
jgi:hypothetical protein